MKRKGGKILYCIDKSLSYEEAKEQKKVFMKTFRCKEAYKNTRELTEEESNDWEIAHPFKIYGFD